MSSQNEIDTLKHQSLEVNESTSTPPPAESNPRDVELAHDVLIEDDRKQRNLVVPEVPYPALEWNHPMNRNNPENWHLAKKIYHSFVPTSIAFLCPFGSSLYTPGLEQVIERFGCSREVALLPFALYLLGLSFGPVIAAPMSETFGRKKVYLIGLPLFGLFTLGAGFSQSIASLIVCRFFAGLFSSPGLSVGAGTITDVWAPENKGLPMAAFATSVQMGPSLAPMVGGFVVTAESWRWTQWVILFALVFILAITLGTDETYKKVILSQQAKQRGILYAAGEDRTTKETIKLFVRETIIRPLHMLFTELIAALFAIYVAINFGLLNAFFAAFPQVFEDIYGFDLIGVGLSFLGQAVGSLFSFFIVLAFDRYYYQALASRSRGQIERSISSIPPAAAKLPPEQRLFIAMIGAPMLPASLFWFGWTARASIHWISPVAAQTFFSCGQLLIFTCASLYLTDWYGARYGASAWASNTFLRYLFSAVFPLFAQQMFRGLGVEWASSLLAFVTLALVPIPFAFYIWGDRLRKESAYVSDR